jgi:hypothetical protein
MDSKTWITMESFREKNSEEEKKDDCDRSEDEGDVLIKDRENAQNEQSTCGVSTAEASQLSVILDSYDALPRIAKKLNVLHYWERQKWLHPERRRLCYRYLLHK